MQREPYVLDLITHHQHQPVVVFLALVFLGMANAKRMHIARVLTCDKVNIKYVTR